MSSKPLRADTDRFAGPVPGDRQHASASLRRLDDRRRGTSPGRIPADFERSTDQLVARHAGLVQRIAQHLTARMPSTVEIDDLVQSGMVGLLEAAANFDPARGACFATYAGIRIRGSMLDDLRRQDWTPRSVHPKHREVRAAIRAIESETGRPARAREIAKRLDVSLDEYYRILVDSSHCRLFNLDDAAEDRPRDRNLPVSNTSTPDQEVYKLQFRDKLTEAIDRLSEREKIVLSLYYERDLNLKEIGRVLDVSESRVCQIHSRATLRLRTTVRNNL